MRWLLESIMTLLGWLITSVLNAIGNSVLKTLTMDIGMGTGSNKSVFDIVFNNMFTFADAFAALATGILIINFVWQIFKIMVSAEATETPFSLVGRTLAAGIGIGFSTRIINVVEYFFSIVYKAILGDGSFDVGTFTSFNFASSLVEVGERAMDTLVVTFLGLIFTIAISWEFLMFMAEAVERYVILGVLYYTSPLAFSVAGSKSTSSIFSSWLRMLFSQHLLMVFNVFFFRLFIDGFSKYQTAVTQMGEATGQTGHGGLTLVWYLMMYAILHVGTRMDTYLATLGLSTAQAGRGLGAAVVGSFTSATHTVSTLAHAGKTVAKPIASGVRGAYGHYKDTHRPMQKDPKTGNLTAASISDIASGKGAVSSASGKEVGGAFMQRNSSFAEALKRMGADPNTAQVSAADGRVSMSGVDKNGNKAGLTFTEVTPENEAALRKQQGVMGTVGSGADARQYFMQVQGSQDARAQALVATPEMEKANADWVAEKEGRSCDKILDENGEWTGAFRYQERDAAGNVVNGFENYPQSVFKGDDLPASITRDSDWGGQACWKVDTSQQEASHPTAASNLNQSDGQRMANAINSQFQAPAVGESADSGGLNLTNASMNDKGIIEGTKADGSRVAMAPIADFQPAAGMDGVQLRQATNGAMYAEVPLEQNATAASAFTPAPPAAPAGTPPTSNVSAPTGASRTERAENMQRQFSSDLGATHFGRFDSNTGAFTMSDGASTYMYAPANQFKPASPDMSDVSTVTSKDGEVYYKAPYSRETGTSPFVPVQQPSADGGAPQSQPAQPTQIETPNIGHVSPVDTMATARDVFKGDQISPDMTHMETLQNGAMRAWNETTGQQEFIVPAAAFNVKAQQGVANITATDGQQFVRISAMQGQTLADVAQEKPLDSTGRHIIGSLKDVPVAGTPAPDMSRNTIRRGASEHKKNKK